MFVEGGMYAKTMQWASAIIIGVWQRDGCRRNIHSRVMGKDLCDSRVRDTWRLKVPPKKRVRSKLATMPDMKLPIATATSSSS